MHSKLENWIQVRSGGSPSLRMTWEPVAKTISSWPFELQTIFLPVLVDFAITRSFLRSLSFDDEPVVALRNLLKEVDESDEPLSAWIAGIHEVQVWTSARGKRVPLSAIAGYVGCSASMSTSTARYSSLPETVKEMLKEYGFAGSDQG